MDREMMKALEMDGEKLRQLTGEDHGPWCPNCLGDGCLTVWHDITESMTDAHEEECPECKGTGRPQTKT